ncbi:prolyl oligopeptidase family serine peptidase [Chromobacterium violaceum]|uniref:S9 family peptidase n=1 Tax=Chromobacterium violaceum TaxID=536 RepID=UPI0009DAAFF2|nr:prolyl oligopeptidase family serine peptidase [Chromobacterium violaceum]OQS47001.1 S9 family peptidase [Chromobacterium violaceum]OQS51844.1 S9 family peptidase [Chromobacterium violaceum]QRO34102.1 S9 family peptidase [Chromobacterium violaceum]QRQ16095.1 S9 family peptidase [Chromobacterium violaceum]
MTRSQNVLAGLLLAGLLAPHAVSAEGYQTPPPELAALVDAPRTPLQSLNPQRDAVLQTHRPGLPAIADVAQPELKLAGLRLNPRMRAASRFDFGSALTLLDVKSGKSRPVTGLPARPRIADNAWSPDGKQVALSLWGDRGVELWLLDAASARARRLGDFHLNASSGRGFAWMGAQLLVKLLPAGQGPAPEKPSTPTGPNIQQSAGGALSQTRTYPDLLKTPYDADLLDYELNSQLALVDLSGRTKLIGKPDRYLSVQASPDRRYLLATKLQRPYSTLVPLNRFPRRIEVLNLQGDSVHLVAQRPLLERMPSGNDAVETGPREVEWRTDAPATLFWAEAQDGGDPSTPAKARDALYLLPAPFQQPPLKLQELASRFAGIQWGRGDLALVSEYWWKTRDLKVWRVRPAEPDHAPTLLNRRSSEDRYADPGSPAMVSNADGLPVLQTSPDGGSLYLLGEGASPEGDRPFIDQLSLADNKATRLWRSQAPWYEAPMAVLDGGKTALLSREQADAPPNLYLKTLGQDGGLKQLTFFPHPTPQLKNVQKRQLRYKRADGIDLTATLYLPPGYNAKRDGPLPMLMWAYPAEFKSADAASQVTDSPYRFNRVGYWGPEALLARGYAVLDDPSMPIVGAGKQEPNDTYLPQLKMDAQAAVDEVVRLGVADRDRIAIGGHSYGAFMTANLLAHTRLFRAGIARSGAYNRTLTPFGFQSEERDFWQAKDVYQAMSPFNYAEQIKDALLLIHGEADNNPGTFPIQSERMYQALQGLGGTVRLAMLPAESHGYRARESILHMLWEEDRWLDQFVKRAKPRAQGTAAR